MNLQGFDSTDWLRQTFVEAVPEKAVTSIVEWAEKHVRLVGSAKTEVFDRRTGPWLNEVIECGQTPGRYSFVKPIQSGGTTAGEIILAYWISTWNNGDVSYFWPNDLKAIDRWARYTEKRLKACKVLMRRAPNDRFRWQKGLITFDHLNFAQLGVRTDRNVSSDTLRGVICEELHDEMGGWTPGRLEQVFGRQRAVWNAISFLISNASHVGDQFHQAFEAGTQEEWSVRCSGCGLFHVMRGRWEDKFPEKGGLRYDGDKCRRADGSYDYNKLVGTIRYQMPCGCIVRDTPAERRALSLSGKYAEPKNKNALPNERSFRLEAVAIHDLKWVDLIVQKHRALRALKSGDPSMFEVYERELECRFWNPADRPSNRPVVLADKPKDRAGLPDKKFRFAALDYQEGRADDHPHYWALIMDFNERGDGLVVFEGRCESVGSVLETLRRFDVQSQSVIIDTSYNTEYLYDLALAEGWHAVKLEKGKIYKWSDDTFHCFSEPEPLWTMARRAGPVTDDPGKEAVFSLVSKPGAFDLLSYQRASQVQKWEVPSDASEEFKQHFTVWNLEPQRVAATNELKMVWVKSSDKAPDHLFCCASYIAVLCEYAGITVPPESKEESSTIAA